MIFMLRTYATETVDLGSISDRASQHNKNEYFPFSYLLFSIKNKQGKMVLVLHIIPSLNEQRQVLTVERSVHFSFR